MEGKNWLKGAWDLHIHVAPDVVKRKCTERVVAQRMHEKGMSGGAIKCHFFETIARATLANEDYPDIKIVGGITLNRSVGGLNPEAVLKAGMLGGKMLWFPTMDAAAFQEYKHKGDNSFDSSGLLRVCGKYGELKPEVYTILEAAAKYDMVTGTGHLEPEEGLKVVEAAFSKGVKKVVLTHVEHPAIDYSVAQQKEAVLQGAYIEHSFNNVHFGRCTMEKMIEQIREVGPEHVILTGDFGQHDAPYFDDAMQSYLETFAESFTEDEINAMVVKNPEYLICG
ncbi:MAG: amidohydrolase [Synergistaceae bacterium]|nr:amidohydrolase [Synergistaceae bacterium]MBQ6113781.1 amidohydrolase [Synergistaceae bacterium]MBR0186132.1 amidohydrolase [Synergistaceae bacterium]